uniref:EAL domain-containing protein n=1 Tax=Panagrolaimus sp. JU765 TaxID=591449 RepID=A0AC34QIE5_9BILA
MDNAEAEKICSSISLSCRFLSLDFAAFCPSDALGLLQKLRPIFEHQERRVKYLRLRVDSLKTSDKRVLEILNEYAQIALEVHLEVRTEPVNFLSFIGNDDYAFYGYRSYESLNYRVYQKNLNGRIITIASGLHD